MLNDGYGFPLTVDPGTPVVPYEPVVCPLTVDPDATDEGGVCPETVNMPVAVMSDVALDNGVTLVVSKTVMN